MFLILAAAALTSAPAAAYSAEPTLAPLAPQQTGGTGGSATTVRERCTNCRSRTEDRYREKLLLQIDSLRWTIENKRLSDDERRRTITDLNSAIRSLQQSLDESERGVAGVTVEAVTAAEAVGGNRVQIARIPMRARGYLGVTFDGPSAEIARPGDYSVRFYKYPRIALVEPSSPAERAGVVQGDTLMSFNGTDVVENEISLSKLLVPDAKIVMRVRRDGNSKDLKVTVGEAPDYYVRRREVPVAAARVSVGGYEPVRVQPALPAQAPQAPQAPPTVYLWQDYEGIAGARVETVSEGLAKALDVEDGVLIVRARPGTPAYRSGLRDGDVIVRAGDQRVRTVPMLRNVLAASDGDEGVKLLIRRERKEKDVTLRW